jgi:uncharacterized protein (DUF4415 family)
LLQLHPHPSRDAPKVFAGVRFTFADERFAYPEHASSRPDCSTKIPELTDEWFEKADLHAGETLVRRGRGRPPVDTPKKLVSLRLDQDVIDQFRAGGPGWQSRINAALRKHLWGK